MINLHTRRAGVSSSDLHSGRKLWPVHQFIANLLSTSAMREPVRLVNPSSKLNFVACDTLNVMYEYSILLVTLPTQPNAVRIRIWRSLKALGCVALRDGAYILPIDKKDALERLALEVVEHGGSAQVMSISPTDSAQQAAILAQFDRTAAYEGWYAKLKDDIAFAASASETEARRRFRSTSEALAAIEQTDFYPADAVVRASQQLIQFRQLLDLRFSKGEPQSVLMPIARLSLDNYQNRRWATRARPWVDRLACAWLIARFIDKTPKFVWLDEPLSAPKNVVGYDYDGAFFTHVGERTSFEVMLASFDFVSDGSLARIASAVNSIDVGGMPVGIAPGLEQILAGLREIHSLDADLMKASNTIFDALYSCPGPGESKSGSS